MNLTGKQRGVIKGMVFGFCIALVIVVLGSWANPFSFNAGLEGSERISIAIQSALIPGLFLVVSVGRLARHRFFTPEDIDGGGLSNNTEQARILQSLVQNSLEQFSIAFLVYLAWAVVMPAAWLSVVPLAALSFAIGRLMFFSGYNRGAASRALGFTLSFYPSLLMLVCILGFFLWQIIS